jgi:signal transduction histidine kinase
METEIVLIICIMTAVIIIFIAGLLLFVNQLRNRRQLHEKEKAAIEKQHKLDLLNDQLSTQKQTMQFIGSEIHDSVAQKLTLASLYARKLEYENNNPATLNKLEDISTIINDSLDELRNLSRTLSNDAIRDHDLAALLNTECQKINATGICRVELCFDSKLRLSFIIKAALLRVIQEFIQNSLKHARCDRIQVKINEQDEGLAVVLSDNGKGFDINVAGSAGVGLDNMKRRIALIGGTFQLQSNIDNGTILSLFIDNKNLLPA